MLPHPANAQASGNSDSAAFHSQQARISFNNAKARRGRSSADLLFREDSAFMYHAARSGDTGLVLQSRVWHAQNLINYNKLPQAGRLISDTRPWLNQWPMERFGWAEYYETLGHWYYKSFKFPEALANYQIASGLALGKKDLYRYHRIQESIATVWQLRGRSDSIQKVYDALEYYEKNNYPADAVGAAKVIALGYAVSGNPDKAIEYYRRAAEHAETVNDKKMKGSIQANLADLYLAQKKYPQALDAIRTSINLYSAVGFTDGQALAEIQQGRILTAMDQLTPALEAFNRGDSLNRLHPSKGVEMASTLYRGQWNLRQKKNAAADSLYAQSAKTASDYVDPTLLRNATLKAAEGMPGMQQRPHTRDSLVTASMREITKPAVLTNVELSSNEREALQTLNPYTGTSAMADSSLIRINHREMQDAEARYRLSEKRDSLQVLQSVAETAQESQRWTLALSAAALLASLGLGLLAIRRYRQWKKADAERKQLALLKQEAHHQAKNHLAVVARLIDMAEKELEKPLAIKVLGARVKTLETLQQVLYQQDAANGLVPMGTYLHKLLPLLTEGYATEKPIALQIDADVALPAPMASQLALLINELITNSAKYAWSNSAEPAILLHLRGSDGQWHLDVSDNGRGFPDPPGKGYGQRLVQGILHTLQGSGGYTNTKDGVSFQCQWPMTPYHAHG
jgi:two-component sensor histidine kinase/tetratricopeptide (TPR) repeat protein